MGHAAKPPARAVPGSLDRALGDRGPRTGRSRRWVSWATGGAAGHPAQAWPLAPTPWGGGPDPRRPTLSAHDPPWPG